MHMPSYIYKDQAILVLVSLIQFMLLRLFLGQDLGKEAIYFLSEFGKKKPSDEIKHTPQGRDKRYGLKAHWENNAQIWELEMSTAMTASISRCMFP